MPNQILNAMRTFGVSLVILDEKDPKRTSLKLLRLFTASIKSYTGTDNYFRVLSLLDRLIDSGIRS